MTGYSPDSERSGLNDPLAFLDDTQESEPQQRRRTVDESPEVGAPTKVEAAEQSVGKRRRNLAAPVPASIAPASHRPQPASHKQHLNETGEQDVGNEQALGVDAAEPQAKKSSRRRRTPPTVEFAIKRPPKPIEMIVGKHGHTAGLGGPTAQLRNPAAASSTAEPASLQRQPRFESRGRSAEQNPATVIDLNDSLADMSFEFLDDGEGVANTDALGRSGVKQHENRNRRSQGSPSTFNNSIRNSSGEAFDTTRVGAHQGYTDSLANRGRMGISLWQIAAVSCVVLGALLAVLFGFDYLGERSAKSLLVDNNSGLGSENESMADGGTRVSNSSVSSNTAQLSLSEQTSNAIASLDRMISEEKLTEAEQFLSSLDLVVYGYGQPEFDVIKQTVATLRENPDAFIPNIESLTAVDPVTVDDAVTTDLRDEKLVNVEANRLAEIQAAAVENDRLALEQIEQARLQQEAAQQVALEEAQQATARIDAERIAQETAQIKAEAARIVEESRLAKEAARLAEERRVAQAAQRLAEERKLLEEQRRSAEVETARIAEEKRILDEAAVLAEQRRVQQEKDAAAQRETQLAEERRVVAEAAEQAKIAERQQQLAEEARLEQERLAEQQRVVEQARIVEQQKLAEAKVLEQKRIEQAQAKAAADATVAEEAKLAQEKRLQAEAEQRRQAQARVREAARLATQRRLAENAAREAQRVAEATRLKELGRTEERARQVELAQQRARLRQKAAQEQQRLAEQVRPAALAGETAEVPKSRVASRPITVTTVKEVETATVQRNQPISDNELAAVYRRFQALEKALESKDMTQVVRLTEQSSTKIGVFLQLFQNFESMDIRIEAVSAQSSNSTVVGRLRIMTMQRTNGDSAIPSDLYRDTLIESTRESNGSWSRIRW